MPLSGAGWEPEGKPQLLQADPSLSCACVCEVSCQADGLELQN